MPRRRQGYNLAHILLVLLARRGYRLADLRKIFGDSVYAYIGHLRRSGVVVVRDGVVPLNASFLDTVRVFERELEKSTRGPGTISPHQPLPYHS